MRIASDTVRDAAGSVIVVRAIESAERLACSRPVEHTSDRIGPARQSSFATRSHDHAFFAFTPLLAHVVSAVDQQRRRPVAVTIALFVVVVVAAAVFAHYFKELAYSLLDVYARSTNPIVAAASLPRLTVFLVTTMAVGLAATLGRFVQRGWPQHVGLKAMAMLARDDDRSISLQATSLRSMATWLASAGMVSIGRESAIIETGGALGATLGRAFRGRGDAMAAAGIAAAFAAAYHAPVAAVFYVEETLRVRSRWRAMAFTVLGAGCGHAASVLLLGATPIFPPIQGAQSTMLAVALVCLVPAVVVAHGILQLRTRVSGGALLDRAGRPWLAIGVLSAVAGAMIAWTPAAAGNGMEALRAASVSATMATAIALSVGKMIATTAALGAGAPGGVLTPTMSITSGSVLVLLLGAHAIGLSVLHPWDVMVAVMAVGVAVGLRSPLVAIFLIPEMLGNYSLVPLIAVVVGLAVVVDRGLIRLIDRYGHRVPQRVYDEDA